MLAFLLSPPARADTPDAAQMAALTGAWHLAEARDAVQARVDAALEATLAPYNVMIRAIARPPLRAALTFCDDYHLALTATSFTLACDARQSFTIPFDTPPVPLTLGDLTVAASASFAAGAPTLSFRAAEGSQRVTYRVDGDGTFHIDKTVHSDRLGAEVSWPVAYRRAGG